MKQDVEQFFAGVDFGLMPPQVTFLKKILEGGEVKIRILPPRASYADRRFVATWYELKARIEAEMELGENGENHENACSDA